MEKICVHAPITVANLGSGFDLIGLALHQVADEVIVEKNNNQELRIIDIQGDNGKLPRQVNENTCTVAIQALLMKLESKQGFDISIHKKIGFNSGLGSSASSAVAGVVAVNELLGNPFQKIDLIEFALAGEYIASKGFHADNIAPCLLGGITFVHSIDPIRVSNIPFSKETTLAVLYQPVKISTAEARAILPSNYDRKTTIQQTNNFGSLLTGLYTQTKELVKQGLQDFLATPFRHTLIPHYEALEEAAMNAGALGFNISGSGPSVFAWCENESIALSVKQAWEESFTEKKIPFTIYLSKINERGTVLS
jgi:homoserine kinase